MLKQKKIWFILLLLILSIGAGTSFFIGKKAPSASHQQSIPVKKIHPSTPKKAIQKHKALSEKKVDSSHWQSFEGDTEFPILMYHSISVGNSLRIPESQFAHQMQWLQKNGYYTLTPAEAIEVFKTHKKPANKIVWITFDDGYKDNYEKAYPALKKYHKKATINYITNHFGHKNKLTMPQMNEMRQSGLVTIESHTVHHKELNQMTDAQQTAEFVDSKKWLNDKFHQQTSIICYPVGRFNDQTPKLAQAAGYKLGLTTLPGLANENQGLFTLHRVRISPDLSDTSYQYLLEHGM
ncbi:putative polysaccharide deacetylase YxkH [Dellaglioa algida]|nr:putative polysaccharide deacetylase YxkH [Dellaglioa algida]